MTPWENESSLPVLEFKRPEENELPTSRSKKRIGPQETVQDFTIDETLDVRWLPDLSDGARAAIVDGQGVDDRSAYLLRATHALISAGLDKSGILTVLSDPSTFLGQCAYDHAQTKSRARAAQWLWNYTVKDVMAERDPVPVFSGVPVVPGESLSDEQTVKQADAINAESDWRQYIARTGKEGAGPPKATLNNIDLILKNDIAENVFVRDLFALRDTYGCDTPWGGKKGTLVADDDVPQIRAWFGKQWGFEPGRDLIYDSITLIACQHAFDPVKDQLRALPEWDRMKRLDTWLVNHFEGQGDPEYLAQVFRKWMCAMVMRVFHPGMKFDWMPIFEGAQGVGKSSFGRLLVGDNYFLDWLPNLADKDSSLALQGAWAVEMGELASMRKNELETVKAYLTRTVDKFRPPFGRRTVESPRRCVFYGTTNRETYLRDDTGNRRFKPVKVGKLNFDRLERDRTQLFAEAIWLYESCAENELTLDLTGAAKVYELRVQNEKMIADESDLMAEVIQDFLGSDLGSGFDVEKFRIHDLFEGQGPLMKWRFEQRNMQFAARALKLLGGSSWKSDGRKVWKLPTRERFVQDPVPDDFY